MREIKFRGYNREGFIYGSAIHHDKSTDNLYIIPFGMFNDYWEIVNKIDEYTGIKDKQGNEIYENDLIINKYGITRVVKFYEGCFVLINQGDLPDVREDLLAMQIYDELKVVGNIHEGD